MKSRFAWASALSLAAVLSSQVGASAITNGVIIISTREPQDTAAAQDSVDNRELGPGMCTPGDVAIGQLLGDYGYTTRLLLDRMIGDSQSWCSAPPARADLLVPFNTNMAPALLIISGSSAGAAVPAPTWTEKIPIMMGEHTTIGSGGNAGSIFMYDNTLGSSTDPNQGNLTNIETRQWMRVVNPTHPIMQGIPLNAEGRVKIFRDPYPEENAHLPSYIPGDPNGNEATPKQNYEFRWCTHAASAAAPGTVVLGTLCGTDTLDTSNRSCFAVCDVGGQLATGASVATSPVRMVHFFVNEQGSGGSRRIFYTLTDLGRILFVRAAKWAMGETLAPYQSLGVIKVAQVSPTQIQLTWTGTSTKNYKVLGTANIFGLDNYLNWQTVAQDIHGVDGVDATTTTLDISAGPQYAYFRVMPVP